MDKGHTEGLWGCEHVLAVFRRPQVLGRGGDADDGHFAPGDLEGAPDGELEVACGMRFHDDAFLSLGIEVGAFVDVDHVDLGLTVARHPDDPADEGVLADLERHVGLAALDGGRDAGDPGRVDEAVVGAGDGHVRHGEPLVASLER